MRGSDAVPRLRFFLRVLQVPGMLIAIAAAAQDMPAEQLDLDGPGSYLIRSGSLSGDEIRDYRVHGQRSQILSVDLDANGASTYFNVLPGSSDDALFVGMTRGSVADVPLAETDTYRIRVYLDLSAGSLDQRADFTIGVGLSAPEYADGLSGGPDFWEVSLGGGETLNVREGPSTRYDVAGVLRRGEPLQNKGCRMTGDERWCRIRATNSGLMGWVAGRYLIERPGATAPQAMHAAPKREDRRVTLR